MAKDRKLGVKCALGEIMRLYNAARRNRDKGGRFKELFAGRCEGIAMTLSKLGYRIVKGEGGGYVVVRKGGAK